MQCVDPDWIRTQNKTKQNKHFYYNQKNFNNDYLRLLKKGMINYEHSLNILLEIHTIMEII